MRVLVALGGNALARPGGKGDWTEAVREMRKTARPLARIAAAGHELILTHGNGPQVGRLLRQDELAEPEVPLLPIDVLGAESEGQIGYLIEQELSPALLHAGVRKTVLTLVSRMLVSARDPSFRRPTKPVGRYYSDSEARRLRRSAHWTMARDRARGGWRRLLPSPRPVHWLEGRAVRELLDLGMGRHCIPVVAGGGGIPVVARGRGRYSWVDAVIDKDRTASLVGRELGVDALVIATDVPGIALEFGTPNARWLREARVSELKSALANGEFGEGSMAPKVEAAIDFVAKTRRRAIVTEASAVERALAGQAGTLVRPG
jgi:carbamate kinase